MTNRIFGPVTDVVLHELRERVAKHTMVVWLDKAGHYTTLLDSIEEPTKAIGGELVAYRGSYLELLAILEQRTKGPDPRPLVVHAPGLNRETIKATPLLQVYEVSHPYERALDTLIRTASAGRVPADEVEEFLHTPEVTLAAADAWLAAKTASASDSLAASLRAKGPGPLVADMLEHRHDGHATGDRDTERHALAARFGLPSDWPSATEAHRKSAGLGEIGAEWVMAVEYVHDLRREPFDIVLKPAATIKGALLDACRQAAVYLREHKREDYRALAQNFEDRLSRERTEGSPDDLGRIDTFSFEEDRLLTDALDALAERDWPRAKRRADDRLDGDSVWLRLDPTRHKAWRLVRRSAALGLAIADCDAAGALAFDSMHSLSEAAQAYAEHGAAIDGLHRTLEQAAATDLLDRLPHEAKVREGIAAARAVWRQWAERTAIAWSDLTLRQGALPDPNRQQRTIFEQVVDPMLREGEKTALFLVDALRFEMAQALRKRIGSLSGTRIVLQPRLAELPSVTEVGMNVLTPIARRGRLHPRFDAKRRKIEAWRDGTTPVKLPADRRKAITARIQGGECGWMTLEKLLDSEPPQLRRKVREYPLLVVHSVQIDKAGENGSGLSEFDRELLRLEKARQLLQAAGVRRFVFTADHGFVIRAPDDETLQFGNKWDAKGRYALRAQAETNDALYSIPLSALDYDDAGSEVLVFPRGLGVLPCAAGRDFVHGGNSPQERVIPVLTIEHRRDQGGAAVHYKIVLGSQVDDPTGHRITAKIERADNQVSLDLVSDPVPLELRAPRGIRLELADATGAARLDGGTLTAQTGAEFTVRFRLLGPSEQRIPVEMIAATGEFPVDGATSRTRFSVTVERSKHRTGEIRAVDIDTEAEPVPKAAQTDDWLAAYADEGVRNVMAHIAKHGAATEVDVQMFLGSARKARAFARHWEEHAAGAPFVLTIETSGSAKTYKKVSDA